MAFDSEQKRIELKIPKEMFRNLEIIAGVCGESVEKHIARLIADEQRLCVLMFHIEGQSIKDIAETLKCSENTVKSRLNYGRKNLKSKVRFIRRNC